MAMSKKQGSRRKNRRNQNEGYERTSKEESLIRRNCIVQRIGKALVRVISIDD